MRCAGIFKLLVGITEAEMISLSACPYEIYNKRIIGGDLIDNDFSVVVLIAIEICAYLFTD